MVLVTGGAFQGKREIAGKLAGNLSGSVEGKDADLTMLCQASVILHLEDWIEGELRSGRDPYLGVERLIAENKKAVITLTELGCGIVPVDAFDRNFREITGRIGCRLAEHAEAVYRVICGVPSRIK